MQWQIYRHTYKLLYCSRERPWVWPGIKPTSNDIIRHMFTVVASCLYTANTIIIQNQNKPYHLHFISIIQHIHNTNFAEKILYSPFQLRCIHITWTIIWSHVIFTRFVTFMVRRCLCYACLNAAFLVCIKGIPMHTTEWAMLWPTSSKCLYTFSLIEIIQLRI